MRELPDSDARRSSGVQQAARATLAAVAIRPLQVDWSAHGGALLGVPFAVAEADLPTLAAMRAAGCEHWTLGRELTPRSIERWIHWLARPAPKQAPELAGVHCRAGSEPPVGEPAFASAPAAAAPAVGAAALPIPLLWWGLPAPDPQHRAIGDRLRAELDPTAQGCD